MTALSLHAVDLTRVIEAWEKKSLDALAQSSPRGRVACALSGPIGGIVIDARRPAAVALASVPAADRRAIFEAVIEDLAMASLHDVPEEGLNAALAVVARLTGNHDLALDRLKKGASPASPEGGMSCAVWSIEPVALRAARNAVDDPSLRDADLPEARVAGVDKSHIQDVLSAMSVVLTALADPGTSLLAITSRANT